MIFQILIFGGKVLKAIISATYYFPPIISMLCKYVQLLRVQIET
jgi:hypothetical protein